MCIPETVGSVETSGMGGEASTHTRKGWRVIPGSEGQDCEGRLRIRLGLPSPKGRQLEQYMYK
jgi:hypothetical protein